MKQAFGLVRRPWGVFYLKNKVTGAQLSLRTSDRQEAECLLHSHNESERQAHLNLSLARVYLNAADPKLATRTWQDVMENLVSKKTDETRRRWEVSIRDKNFDCIRHLTVCETRPEHFDRALADDKASTRCRQGNSSASGLWTGSHSERSKCPACQRSRPRLHLGTR